VAAHFNARTRERIQEQKRALHLLKRAPYLLERAVHCQYRGGLPYSSFQSARARARRGASYQDRYKSHMSSQMSPTSSEKSPTSSEMSPTSSCMKIEPYIFGNEADYLAALFNLRARERAEGHLVEMGTRAICLRK